MDPEALPPLQINSEASYVLAGGLGEIGRSIARWMDGLTRDRDPNIPVEIWHSERCCKQATKDLAEMRCRVQAFACDVTNKSMLTSVIEEYRVTIPPIKGRFQGPIVLKVSCFSPCALRIC